MVKKEDGKIEGDKGHEDKIRGGGWKRKRVIRRERSACSHAQLVRYQSFFSQCKWTRQSKYPLMSDAQGLMYLEAVCISIGWSDHMKQHNLLSNVRTFTRKARLHVPFQTSRHFLTNSVRLVHQDKMWEVLRFARRSEVLKGRVSALASNAKGYPVCLGYDARGGWQNISMWRLGMRMRWRQKEEEQGDETKGEEGEESKAES